MVEYIVNSGDINMLIKPDAKQFYILKKDVNYESFVDSFISGKELPLEGAEPAWFQYDLEDEWMTYDGEVKHFDELFSEADLIDRFALKKFNYGGLVATRDTETGDVKVYKKEKLHLN